MKAQKAIEAEQEAELTLGHLCDSDPETEFQTDNPTFPLDKSRHPSTICRVPLSAWPPLPEPAVCRRLTDESDKEAARQLLRQKGHALAQFHEHDYISRSQRLSESTVRGNTPSDIIARHELQAEIRNCSATKYREAVEELRDIDQKLRGLTANISRQIGVELARDLQAETDRYIERLERFGSGFYEQVKLPSGDTVLMPRAQSDPELCSLFNVTWNLFFHWPEYYLAAALPMPLEHQEELLGRALSE